MPKFFVSGHLPDDFDPASMDEAMVRGIHALNDEMDAAGVTFFACGLWPVSHAKTLRAKPGGGVLVTDGPYTEAKEHVGGISILECKDMEEALAWARKSVLVTRMPCEVREIFFVPPPDAAAEGA
jgi:hypothetical protein